MNNITLLILAGGIGSRYKGAKQVDEIGKSGETLMEYALFDALKTGIKSFVFIINNQFPLAYKTRLSELLEAREGHVVFIEQTNAKFIPKEYISQLKEREKPLGTAHAVLCAKEVIDGPCITLNADDFYGYKTFKTAVDFIQKGKISAANFGIITFILKNTLSKNGSVSRGICQIKDENLLKVEEFTSILTKNEKITGKSESGEVRVLTGNENVSMNCWIINPAFFGLAEKGLKEFLTTHKDLSKAEFYLPTVIDIAIQRGGLTVSVLQTPEKWFGLTYQEDKKEVLDYIRQHVEKGAYPSNLWA